MTTEFIQAKVSEYKIGHTTYTVKTVFSPEAKSSLLDIIQKLIILDSEKMLGKTEQTINKQAV